MKHNNQWTNYYNRLKPQIQFRLELSGIDLLRIDLDEGLYNITILGLEFTNY